MYDGSELLSKKSYQLIIPKDSSEGLSVDTDVKWCSIDKMTEKHEEQYVIKDSDSIDEIKIF